VTTIMKAASEQANRLHQQGREAGSSGEPVRALELFHQAHKADPTWPYPPYDIAFTYLLHDHLDEAETWYAVVDQLAPRGFFTAKTSLDIIRREKRGEVFKGFAKAYAMLEWEDKETRRTALRQIVERYPGFAPAWKDLAALTDGDQEKLAALDHGLAGNPDDETYGVLISNKALVLGRLGRQAEGIRLIEALLADRRCTQGAEAMAKLTVSGLR
jgi:tetratricopeptide (TPR) repeat protein